MDYPKPGELLKRKAGNKECTGCGKSYNNKSLPKVCSNSPCKTYPGGKFVAKVCKLAAILITAFIVSVRLNEKGPNVRVFVDMGEEKKVRLAS